jgi:hypothetical protein
LKLINGRCVGARDQRGASERASEGTPRARSFGMLGMVWGFFLACLVPPAAEAPVIDRSLTPDCAPPGVSTDPLISLLGCSTSRALCMPKMKKRAASLVRCGAGGRGSWGQSVHCARPTDPPTSLELWGVDLESTVVRPFLPPPRHCYGGRPSAKSTDSQSAAPAVGCMQTRLKKQVS